MSQFTDPFELQMNSRNYVNGTNLTPTDCEPTAPPPTDYIEIERYSRALAILADVREILWCLILDVSSSSLSTSGSPVNIPTPSPEQTF